MVKYNLSIYALIGLFCVMLTGCGNVSAHESELTDAVNIQNGESKPESASEESETDNAERTKEDASEKAEGAFKTGVNEENILNHGQWIGLQWELTESGQLTVTGDLNVNEFRDFNGSPWSDYKATITEAYLDFTGARSLSGFFGDYENLTRVDLSNFDTRNVTDMSGMFSGCSSLAELDLSNLDTGNVTNMNWMFSDCSSLTELDLSNFDTGNVMSMSGMFNGCSSLAELDLSNFDTGNVISMGLMFDGCSSLTKLDISNFDTTNVTDTWSMFSGCKPKISR